MRIGIDIDDTITNSHDYVVSLKKKYLPQYNPNEMLPDAIFQKFIHKYDAKIHKYAPLKEGVVEALTYLKDHGHTIYIMSARGNYSKKAYEDSLNYLSRHNIPYDKLMCNLGDKIDAVKNEKIDIFIDDNIRICDKLKDNGVNVIKMKRHDDEENNHLVCANWEEIIKCIKENFNG
ncbi:MAG: hypothetical protein K2G03_06820 [Bacilli bacterium]|nr:hypothetical protein [Bacilli bacterium]